MNEQTLVHVMNSIKRIHSSNTPNNIDDNLDINIYDNYSNKLKTRYSSYNYSRFQDHESVFNYLLEKLTIYEKSNTAKLSVIHGDTVMTNILINQYDKIKFIDMKGKLGDTLTIYGDSLYDWAKLYQSLIGYDKILMNKNISFSYESKMIQVFESYFIQLFSSEDLLNLKLITKSLLFTLIPLHHNDKCSSYYNLIKTI
jgi:hypothetical protein